MNVGFVFTNFNNSNYTRDVVVSICKSFSGANVRIVIVDNASCHAEVCRLQNIAQEFPCVKMIYNDKNVGYFRGLNLGIAYLRMDSVPLNYIVIGNNDLLFPNNFVDQLDKHKSLFEVYPVVSPNIVTLEGVHQNPHVISRISTFREIIYDFYYSSYVCSVLISLVARITRRFTDRRDEEQHDISQVIHQGYGACYILGPLFFEYFNELWSPTFLMGEEFFLSLQLKERGLHLFYESDIIVKHHDHATMGKLPSRKLWRISRESHKEYRKYVKVTKMKFFI